MQQRAVGHDETRRNGQPKVSKTSKSDTFVKDHANSSGVITRIPHL